MSANPTTEIRSAEVQGRRLRMEGVLRRGVRGTGVSRLPAHRAP